MIKLSNIITGEYIYIKIFVTYKGCVPKIKRIAPKGHKTSNV